MLVGLAGLVGVTVAMLYGAPQLYRVYQVWRWSRIRGMVALTYDDGPDDVTTVALLDLLDELGVVATFYLVGSCGERYPQVLERLRASRHELGTHAHSHRNAWSSSPLLDYRDAMAAYQSLGAAVESTSSFRPPYGKVTLPTLLAMWRRGRRVEWWSIATNDHADPVVDAATHARRILDQAKPVVLMHCSHAEPRLRNYTLELTRALVEQARARGLDLVTMRQLAGYQP